MSTPTTTETDQSARPRTFQQKLLRWTSMVVGVIFVIVGFVRIYNVFSPGLPSCTSDSAKTSIGEIFKQKNVELSSLTNQKTLTDQSSEKTCQADFLTPAEAGTLFYRIFWQNKSAQVLITKVDTRPR